jgi:nucleotide-binding universal stress UspA family protein
MKTLLGMDGSEFARTAMTTAAQLLKKTDNSFEMTCVVPEATITAMIGSRSPGLRTEVPSKYQREMQRRAEQALENSRSLLQPLGIKVTTFTVTGSAGDTLVQLAAKYDVIVVGAQGRLERPAPGLGPVASRVVENAAGTILVGRGLVNESAFRILLAVDGSASSENAAAALAGQFDLANAEITLMHVVEKPWLRLGVDPSGDLESPDPDFIEPENERLFIHELRNEAERIIEQMRRRFAGSCLAVDTCIAEGSPANELLRQTEVGEYDLVVLGATGSSDLKHTMLGSVSFKLASYAPCSVAVIR